MTGKEENFSRVRVPRCQDRRSCKPCLLQYPLADHSTKTGTLAYWRGEPALVNKAVWIRMGSASTEGTPGTCKFCWGGRRLGWNWASSIF